MTMTMNNKAVAQQLVKLAETLLTAGPPANVTSQMVSELEDIQQETLQLVGQAERIIRGTGPASRAEAYWIPGIKLALEGDPHNPAGSPSMKTTIEELKEELEMG